MSMKLSNQGLSSREEFIIFIKSIGFTTSNNYSDFDSYILYYYKEFIIYLYANEYCFWNTSKWINYHLYDLTPIENYFKQELRSIKLKNIL